MQVHPAKTEMWYIVEAEPGAKLVYGLNEKYDPAAIAAAIETGTLENHLNYVEVRAGEVYFIPSGLVHAICEGIVIAEIQQNSDVTYRLYDYMRRQPDGSLRELHVAQSLDTIRDFTPDGIDAIRYSRGKDGASCLANCDFFRVDKLDLTSPATVGGESFTHVLCVGGNGTVGGETAKKGDGFFIPAGLTDVSLTPEGDEPFSLIISR